MDREYTGNAYVFAPYIARHDGAIRAINIVHRGLDGLVEWRAARDTDADDALFRPDFRVDGESVTPNDLRWERLDAWIPQLQATLGPELRAVITYFAPPGFESFARGLLVRVEIENRGGSDRVVEVALRGDWRWTVLCAASARPVRGGRRLVARRAGFAFEVGEGAAGAALALAGGGAAVRSEGIAPDGTVEPVGPGREWEGADGEPLRFRLGSTVTVSRRRRATITFAVAAGPDRDGAFNTARRLAAQDSGQLLQDARIEATRIARRSAPRAVQDLARRNLLYVFYAGVARAIDDDRLYPVASRMLEHGPCAAIDERDVLYGTLPALVAADPFVARELLLRMFELYSDRAGTHLRYLSGGVLSPGFSLSRFCAYVDALNEYTREAADPSLAGEPLVQDVLREMDDWLWGRLHRDVFLCSSELGPSGEPPEYAFTTIDNVRAWRFCRGLNSLWQPREGEPPPRFRDAADELSTAIWQNCVVSHNGTSIFAGSVDLEGNAAIYDDPEGPLQLLPVLGFCDADDPIWTDTMELLRSAAYPLWRNGRVAAGLAARDSEGRASFAPLCADLLTNRRAVAIAQLQNLRTPGGIACRAFDVDSGESADGPWSAAHAGMLAWGLLLEPSERRPKPGKR